MAKFGTTKLYQILLWDLWFKAIFFRFCGSYKVLRGPNCPTSGPVGDYDCRHVGGEDVCIYTFFCSLQMPYLNLPMHRTENMARL